MFAHEFALRRVRGAVSFEMILERPYQNKLDEKTMRKIRIVLKKDGTQEIEVRGARGADCVEFTRELEERLGVPEGERRRKPEYDEDPVSEGSGPETELGS